MSNRKQRHGCLTAFLIVMIIANSAAVLKNLFGNNFALQNSPNSHWVLVALSIGAVFNMVCAVALFKWKKWGFWGFIISGIVAFIINATIGLGLGPSLLGLSGIAILYGVLHIGKENKGWTRLD
jgi:hypothetical protein